MTYKPKRVLNRVPFTTTFDPRVYDFFKHISSLWKILGTNHPHIAKFQEPPVLALRQPPNLKTLLVRSKLPSVQPSISQGNSPCGNARCRICRVMITSAVVNVPGGNMKLHPGQFSCNTSNVVYFLKCDLCSLGNYIGETRTSFRLRFNNHKSSIRRKLSVAYKYY